MYLWVGAIPTTPNIIINSLVTVSASFFVGIVREQAKAVYNSVKERVPMFVILLVALLGTAGVTVVWQGCIIATSRATPKI
jgi:hypothetical protein